MTRSDDRARVSAIWTLSAVVEEENRAKISHCGETRAPIGQRQNIFMSKKVTEESLPAEALSTPWS